MDPELKEDVALPSLLSGPRSLVSVAGICIFELDDINMKDTAKKTYSTVPWKPFSSR